MHSFITRCPHCQTAFQVSTAQLKAADGNVRCGACLNVFLARNNFFKGDPTTQPEQNAAEADEIETALFASALQIKSGYAAESDADSEPGWELLEEEPLAEESATGECTDEAFADEFETEDSLAEEELINGQKQMFFDDDAGRTEPLLFANRSSGFDADLQDDNDPTPFSSANRAALHEFSAPVEIHAWQKDKINLLKATGGAMLAIVLIITLGLQLIWFKRDELSLQTEWRPRIEWMCTQLPCTVSAQRDLTAISSENLVVRSHPETENALLVSLSFRNDAAFAQPFPALTLKFTDIDQKPVGMRSFMPQEYLQEELRDMTLMPPNTSVQARVDIVDPGSNAINYEVFLGNLD
jgi:predicted Zn finger-like uncharacterized protein